MKISRLSIYTLILIGISAIGLSFAWELYPRTPGLWEIIFFVVLAVLLEQTGMTMRSQAWGSTSFIVHLAAGILFGGSAAAIIAGTSTAISHAVDRRPLSRLFFNSAQKVLSITSGFLVYAGLGGSVPPSYLAMQDLPVDGFQNAVQRDFGLFFVFAATYFAVNSITVSGAISLTTKKPFTEIWSSNAKGVLGYDLGASTIAILMAWLFTWSQARWGFGSIVLLGVVVPLTFVRKIYGMYRNLEATSQELLEIMVKAIEARDPYTSGHSERVARLSRIIAQEIGGLGSDEVEKIYKAALLHDVGKMYEEFAPLLRKEGKLTSEERELLQTHAIKSAELVAIVSDFKGTVLESVRSHHERWDGRGYPSGIKEDAIPLGARIIMISDTIDAMTTDRPYRKALPPEVVISELQKHRGSQFDPTLVDVVLGSVVIRRLFGEGGNFSVTRRETQPSISILGQRSKSSTG